MSHDVLFMVLVTCKLKVNVSLERRPISSCSDPTRIFSSDRLQDRNFPIHIKFLLFQKDEHSSVVDSILKDVVRGRVRASTLYLVVGV